MNTSTTPRRTGKNIEENKARAEALHNSISEQVELLRTSERWHAFLDFAQSFHDYSLHNLLLLSQNPDATRVAGFRKWQTLGRQVRKGEIGIRIFGYSTKKTTEEDENGDTNLIKSTATRVLKTASNVITLIQSDRPGR